MNTISDWKTVIVVSLDSYSIITVVEAITNQDNSSDKASREANPKDNKHIHRIGQKMKIATV